MDGGSLTTGLRETLSVFQRVDRHREPLTTNEVVDKLDISRRSTYDRLERLADRDILETKKVGARGRVWWPREERDGRTPAADGSDVAEGGHRDVERLAGRSPTACSRRSETSSTLSTTRAGSSGGTTASRG